MCAALGDAAAFEHDNPVRLFHGRESMGNDERRAVAHQLRERGLDMPLGLGVERGGCLIQDQNRRIL